MKQIRNYNTNAYVPVLSILVFSYTLLPPLISGQEYFSIGDYTGLQSVHLEYYVFAFLSTITIATIAWMLTHNLASSLQRISERDESSLHRLSYILGVILLLDSFPLWVVIYNGVPGTRTDSFELIASLRHSPEQSVLISLCIGCGAILFIRGSFNFLIFVFFVGIFPEIFFGTRITAFRLFILMLFLYAFLNIFFKARTWKVLSALILVILSSRIVFNHYSVSNSSELLVAVLGDMMNTYVGTNALLNGGYSHLIDCGLDGTHMLRWFIPPYNGFRELVAAPVDVTQCINSAGFMAGLTPGYGGTPVTDLYVFPTSFLLSAFLFIALIGTIRLVSITWLRSLTYCILISLMPYYFRNGFIASTNHAATIYIWLILPTFLALVTFKYLLWRAQKIKCNTLIRCCDVGRIRSF